MTHPVRIPADIHRDDRVLGPFTVRQTVIGAAAAAAAYGVWLLFGSVWPLPAVVLAAVLLVGVGFAVAVGQRDGLPLEQWLLAAARHHLAPPAAVPHDPAAAHDPASVDDPDPVSNGQRWRVGPRRPPVDRVRTGVSGVGLVDLGTGGVALIASASTINLRLRTATEQDALVAGFARYLHSLTGAVQVLVRAQPLDLRAHVDQLRVAAAVLPHPALAAAAAAHADDLAALTDPHHDPDVPDEEEADMTASAQTTDRLTDDHATAGGGGDGGAVGGGLLTRQVLLVWREPRRRGDGPGVRGVEQRLLRRCGDAEALLTPIGVTVAALDPAAAAELLTACHALPPPPELAPARAPARRPPPAAGATGPRPAVPGFAAAGRDTDPRHGWRWPDPPDSGPGPFADDAPAAGDALRSGAGTGWAGWDQAGWPTGDDPETDDDVEGMDWPTEPLHLPNPDDARRRWPT